MARRDGDRPSWRDIDRKKDSSSHIDKNDPYKKQRRGGRSADPSKGYRTALDTLFEGGAVPEKYQGLAKARESLQKSDGSPRQAALKKIREAFGRAEVEAAVKAYLAVDPELPHDADALLSVLLHPDEGLVRRAIAALDEMHQERPLKRQDLLRQRLRQIEDLAEESKTAEAAEAFRRKL
jgi:hypothetical protein